MKKILLFIVGIIGIGLSFCSAGTFTWSALSSQGIYDSSLSLLDNSFSFNLTGYSYGSNICSRSYPISVSSSNPQVISFNGNSSSIYLTNFCFPRSYNSNFSAYSLYINGVQYSLSDQGNNIYCSDLSSNPIEISPLNGNSFSYYIGIYGNPNISTLCQYPYSYFTNGENNYYFHLYNNVYFTSNFLTTNSARFIGVPVSFSIYYESDPKFKVNYGNTSYEYTLEDNLEIYLNSPVVKNGDIYSYAGSTGINLFYNGTSQFYNKDKLYLFTPSRYSNNIFNPICL